MSEVTIEQVKSDFQFMKSELKDRNKFDDLAAATMNAISNGKKVFTQDDARLDRERERLRVLAIKRELDKLEGDGILNQIISSPPEDSYDIAHFYEVQKMLDCYLVTHPEDTGIRKKSGVVAGFKSPAKSNNEVLLFWMLQNVFNEFVDGKITKGLGLSTSFFQTALSLIEPGRFKSEETVKGWVTEHLRQHEPC